METNSQIEVRDAGGVRAVFMARQEKFNALSTAMMLDWLADKHGLESAAEAGETIERAVDKAYADGIKPIEFGGRNGTADITKAVLAAL